MSFSSKWFVQLLIILAVSAVVSVGYIAIFRTPKDDRIYYSLQNTTTSPQEINGYPVAQIKADVEHRLRDVDHLPTKTTIEWLSISSSPTFGINIELMVHTSSEQPEKIIAGWARDKTGKTLVLTVMDELR